MVTTGAEEEGEKEEEEKEEEGKCAWIFNVSDAAPAVATRAALFCRKNFHISHTLKLM